MYSDNKRGYKTEFRMDGYEIYSHPSPFEGERWYSIYVEGGGPIKRDIISLDDAKEDLFVVLQKNGRSGDDEILDVIGADDSAISVGSAIDKEYGEVVAGIRRPGIEQMMAGGPEGRDLLMRNMGISKGSVCSGFGTDMSYIKSVTRPENGIFKNMSRVR